jgi:hypothetical protein
MGRDGTPTGLPMAIGSAADLIAIRITHHICGLGRGRQAGIRQTFGTSAERSSRWPPAWALRRGAETSAPGPNRAPGRTARAGDDRRCRVDVAIRRDQSAAVRATCKSALSGRPTCRISQLRNFQALCRTRTGAPFLAMAVGTVPASRPGPQTACTCAETGRSRAGSMSQRSAPSVTHSVHDAAYGQACRTSRRPAARLRSSGFPWAPRAGGARLPAWLRVASGLPLGLRCSSPRAGGAPRAAICCRRAGMPITCGR